MLGIVLKLVNMLDFAKYGTEWWKVSGMRFYLRTGMLLLQTTLREVSEHLQDAPLTKSLDQFIEVHKSQLFL